MSKRGLRAVLNLKTRIGREEKVTVEGRIEQRPEKKVHGEHKPNMYTYRKTEGFYLFLVPGLAGVNSLAEGAKSQLTELRRSGCDGPSVGA